MAFNSSTCFMPGHVSIAADTACNGSAHASHCCAAYDVCLDNGFCLGSADAQPNVIKRGSCTDPYYRDPACPKACLDPSGSPVLQTLFLVDLAPPNTSGLYCCGGGLNATAKDTKTCLYSSLGSYAPFAIGNANIIVDRRDGTIRGSSSNALAGARVDPGALNGQDAASLLAATPQDSSKLAAVGAGVGVPLGVLVATLGLLWWRERRRRVKAEHEWDAFQQRLLKGDSSVSPRQTLAAEAMPPDVSYKMEQAAAAWPPVPPPPPPPQQQQQAMHEAPGQMRVAELSSTRAREVDGRFLESVDYR